MNQLGQSVSLANLRILLMCNDQHTGIRKILEDMYSPEVAANIPLLYGGSVNSDNFASYAEVEDVDGLFVGRAAWEPKSFMRLFEMSHQFCEAPPA